MGDLFGTPTASFSRSTCHHDYIQNTSCQTCSIDFQWDQYDFVLEISKQKKFWSQSFGVMVTWNSIIARWAQRKNFKNYFSPPANPTIQYYVADIQEFLIKNFLDLKTAFYTSVRNQNSRTAHQLTWFLRLKIMNLPRCNKLSIHYCAFGWIQRYCCIGWQNLSKIHPPHTLSCRSKNHKLHICWRFQALEHKNNPRGNKWTITRSFGSIQWYSCFGLM